MEYMVEITESKVDNLAENIGKMLKYGSKAMECVEEMRNGSEMGERVFGDYRNGGGYNGGYRYGGYNGGNNGGYGGGYRENGYGMGERQGVPGTGPYSRYR